MNNPVYITGVNKKHPAFILAVDADFFDNVRVARNGQVDVPAFGDPINHYPHGLFLELVQSSLVIREREYLDNGETTHPSRRTACGTKFKKGNPRYKQVLPYLVARQLKADGTYVYFPYRRTKGVGESRLAGNGSLGYGGHVDAADILFTGNSILELKSTIIGSLLREADEEFTVFDAEGNKVPVQESWFTFGDLYILDNSNEVGELHLGLIMHLDIPIFHTLIATEDELAKLPAMTAEQMLASSDFNPENWTSIYLNYITQAAHLLSIDHGGEKVGEVDSTYLASEISALEAGNSDRTHISVQVPPGEDPLPYVEEVVRNHFNGNSLALPVTTEEVRPRQGSDVVNRFISETIEAKIGNMTIPLEVTPQEEEHFRAMATGNGKDDVIPAGNTYEKVDGGING
jgi:predicted NUDIX family phosphoesterase